MTTYRSNKVMEILVDCGGDIVCFDVDGSDYNNDYFDDDDVDKITDRTD